MLWILIAPLLILISVLLWHIYFVVRAKIPTQDARVILVGNRKTNDDLTIPKIIWAYWQQTPTPTFINHCLSNWRRFAPDHEIRFISPETLHQWLDKNKTIAGFDKLPAYRQADWIRLQLLQYYGGIWIDASIILTQNLNWVHELQQERQTEYVGFYFDSFTTRFDQPIIENWFMAAAPESRFIIDLCAEFDNAVIAGEANYIANLKAQNTFDRVIQNLIPKYQEYLIMHVAAAVVLDRNLNNYRLALISAEESAFSFHRPLDSRRHHLYAKLALLPCPKRVPKLVKLRGSERRIFERHLACNWIYSKSFLAKYLAL
jgi:hypothetical protein